MKYLCFFHFVLLKLNVSNCCHTKNLCLYIIFYLKIKNKINLSYKMYTLLQWCKVTNNCFLCIYISSFTWKTTKHRIQYKKKGLKTSFFFSIGWNSTKVCAHVSSTLANKNQRRSTKVHVHKPFLFPSLETL